MDETGDDLESTIHLDIRTGIKSNSPREWSFVELRSHMPSSMIDLSVRPDHDVDIPLASSSVSFPAVSRALVIT